MGSVLVELVGTLALTSYSSSVGVTSILSLSVMTDAHFGCLELVFVCDSLSCFFSYILLSVSLLCAGLLVEYFEYDVSSSPITIFSAVFTQLAL